MEVLCRVCGGLDVHKKTVAACLRGAGSKDRRTRRCAPSGPRPASADWLTTAGGTHVAMESTGVSWRPVSHILESSFAVRLVNAQHVKAVPARKIDIRDCQCIAQRLEPGLLRASFVPPAPVRELRELTRSRRPLIPEHAREVNRIQKVLETAAKGRLHAKVAPLQEALIGRVTPHHAFLLGALLSHVEFLRTADRALRFSEDPPRILGEVIDHARQGQLAAERAVRQK